MNLRRTSAIFRKELLHVVRDSRSLGAGLGIPMSMLLIFGWALSLDVDRIPTYIYDQDHTPQSRELIREFRGSRYFDIRKEVKGYSPIEQDMYKRKCLLAIVIPTNYSSDLLLGKTTEVQILLDGSDSNTASIARGYADSVIQGFATRVRQRDQSLRAGNVPGGGISPEVRVWYNPDMLSRNFIVPGLIAVIQMIITAMLTSLTIAREWENGTMEQLLSTPLRPVEIAAGKLGAYFLVGMADMLICLIVGVFVFGVPLKGSFVFLMISSSVFLFGSLATGILISAASRRQLTAYQMGMLTSFLPAFLLSGFIYPIDNMPRVIQLIALFVPARYFIQIVRGIFLKGTGLAVLWPDFLLLTGYGALMFFWASRKLRQKVA